MIVSNILIVGDKVKVIMEHWNFTETGVLVEINPDDVIAQYYVRLDVDPDRGVDEGENDMIYSFRENELVGL